MRRMGAVSAGFFFLVLWAAGLAVGQDWGADYYEVESLSSYGTIRTIDVAKKKITVTEYDEESEKDFDVVYIVDPKVEFENINSIKDLKPGDEVNLEFRRDETQKTITRIELNRDDQ